SARSIEGFNVFENLAAHHDILPHFGGHSMAAGLTIKIEDIEELRMRLNQQAQEQLTEEDFIPITSIDLEVSLKEISLDVIEEIEKLSPFGINNPTPKVVVKDVSIGQMRKIGSNENHLKLVFEQEGTELEGIG